MGSRRITRKNIVGRPGKGGNSETRLAVEMKYERGLKKLVEGG